MQDNAGAYQAWLKGPEDPRDRESQGAYSAANVAEVFTPFGAEGILLCSSASIEAVF
jgi:hypothetical protein